VGTARRGGVDVVAPAHVILGGVVPVGRDGVDEGVVVKLLFAGGDKDRLAVCFANEFRCVHIGDPDLNWSQASSSQPFAVAERGPGAPDMRLCLHVTAVRWRAHTSCISWPTNALAVEPRWIPDGSSVVNHVVPQEETVDIRWSRVRARPPHRRLAVR